MTKQFVMVGYEGCRFFLQMGRMKVPFSLNF